MNYINMSNNRCEHMPIAPGIPSKHQNGLDRILYFKSIMTSREDAITAIKSRELDPGQMAAARYYVDYSDQTIPASWTGIRMVLGIGGSGFISDDKLYIFDDANFNFTIKNSAGEDIKLSLDETIQYLLDNCNSGSSGSDNPGVSGLTEEQVRTIVIAEIVKQINPINDRISGLDRRISEIDNRITSEHENYSRDIDELRKQIENASGDIDLSAYATIQYVDAKIAGIQIPDLSNIENRLTIIDSSIQNVYNTVNTLDSSITDAVNNINTKIQTLNNNVNSKVDASYVEEYFDTNIKSTVDNIIIETNIPGIVENEIQNQDIEGKVSIAVDEKLADFEGVTTETLDEALQNNEYFTTNVITPIESVVEKVNIIETQIKDLDADINGGEEDEWEI